MTEPPKPPRKRTNPARPQRCSKCGKPLADFEAFNYATVAHHGRELLAALEKARPGEPDTAWEAIGTAMAKATFLIARAEKRCVLCELARQNAEARV